MLIAVIAAVLFLGVARGIKINTLINSTSSSLNAVTMIILVTTARGAFKQVLIDSGTGTAISDYFKRSTLSPLFLRLVNFNFNPYLYWLCYCGRTYRSEYCAATCHQYACKTEAYGHLYRGRKFNVLTCKR
jgi:hypothetical protein